MISEFLKKTWVVEMFKYGIVTAVSYAALLGGTFLLKQFAGLPQSLSYFIVVTLVYVGVYISYTKFVFKTKFSKEQAGKYLVMLVFQWLFNNVFFNVMTEILGVNYLIAVILNIVIFGGVRFFLQRTLVFKKMPEKKIKAVLTFDLEFWHEAEWIKKNLGCQNPADFLTESVRPILELLKNQNGRATFFVTGPVLEKYPELIKEISAAGHEIGSHSFGHKRLGDLNPEEFESKMAGQIEKIASLTGRPVLGFRAPHFSLDQKTKWVLPILKKLGFKYDSSVFPRQTPEYGLKSPLEPYQVSLDDPAQKDDGSGLWELPVAVWGERARIPAAGGIYFRLMNLPLFILALKKISQKRTPVLYFHPHELCALTPKIKKGPWLKLKLKYWGMEAGFKKFEKLSNQCRFQSVQEFL